MLLKNVFLLTWMDPMITNYVVNIDRVTKTNDGFYQIHDYKTCSRMPSPKCIQKDRQLPLYAVGIKKRYPYIRNIRLIWHFLKFDKEVILTPSGRELENVKQGTVNLIGEIENTKDFPAEPSRLCSWCRYKILCGESSCF